MYNFGCGQKYLNAKTFCKENNFLFRFYKKLTIDHFNVAPSILQNKIKILAESKILKNLFVYLFVIIMINIGQSSLEKIKMNEIFR